MKIKNIKLLSILIVLFLVVRVILLIGQPYLDGDNSYVAVFAKHISDKDIRPFFGYNEHYNGGLVVESYLAALLFKLFGVSSIVFKLSALLFSLTLLIISYLFLSKYFTNEIAFISCILYAVPTHFFAEWNLYVVGYMMALLMHIILLWMIFDFFYNNKRSPAFLIVFGLLSAFSYYVLEYVIVLLFVFFIFWFVENKKFFLSKEFWIYVSSFIVGLIPVIIYNITTNLANIKHLFAGSFIHRIVCKYNLMPKEVQFGDRLVPHCDVFSYFQKGINVKSFFLNVFPNFFSDTIYGMIFSIIFLVLFCYLFYKYRKDIITFLSHLIPRKSIKIKKLNKGIFLFIYTLIFILAYFFSGHTDNYHLFPIYPFTFFLMGIALIDIFKSKRKLLLCIIFIILIGNLVDNIAFAKTEKIEDGKGDYSNIISFLNNIDVTHFYSTYFIKWRIIFQTKESIIGSCENLCPCVYRYPPYEEEVKNSASFVYILNKDSKIEMSLRTYLKDNDINYNIEEINTKLIFYNISTKIRPHEFINECSYFDGLPIK